MPNTTYIASYYAPNGHYAATAAYFYRDPAPGPNGGAVVDSPPLHAVRNHGGVVNGVFSYSADEHLPDELLRRDQLLGRRRCSRRSRRPAVSTGVTADRRPA